MPNFSGSSAQKARKVKAHFIISSESIIVLTAILVATVMENG